MAAMETITQAKHIRKTNRRCVVCGKAIEIIINEDETYLGGHYFGRLFTGKNEKAEYWECDSCFNE